MKRPAVLMIGVLLFSQLGGCAGEGRRTAETTEAGDKESFLTVKSTEYKFQAPASFKGGLVTIELDNTGGKEAHEAEFIRVEEGRSATDDMKEASEASSARPAGGPGPVLPGRTAIYTGNLPAGNYIFVCRVPSPDNQQHLLKGMISKIRLTRGPEASLPRADTTIGAKEYEFAGAQKLKAGSQTVRVVNEGREPHNFGLVSLAPGKKASDLNPYLVAPGSPFPQGPPPFTGFNGIVATVAPRDEATRTLELSAKTSYALICFVPDAEGKPHFARGMIEQVDIK